MRNMRHSRPDMFARFGSNPTTTTTTTMTVITQLSSASPSAGQAVVPLSPYIKCRSLCLGVPSRVLLLTHTDCTQNGNLETTQAAFDWLKNPAQRQRALPQLNVSDVTTRRTHTHTLAYAVCELGIPYVQVVPFAFAMAEGGGRRYESKAFFRI